MPQLLKLSIEKVQRYQHVSLYIEMNRKNEAVTNSRLRNSILLTVCCTVAHKTLAVPLQRKKPWHGWKNLRCHKGRVMIL